MPLDRENTTPGDRIGLAANAAFNLYLGAVWFLQDPELTNVPTLDVLRQWWPIEASGLILATIGLLQIAAVPFNKRALAGIMLGAGLGAHLFLTLSIIAAAGEGGSYSGPAWPLYVVAGHLAVLVNLARHEGGQHT